MGDRGSSGGSVSPPSGAAKPEHAPEYPAAATVSSAFPSAAAIALTAMEPKDAAAVLFSLPPAAAQAAWRELSDEERQRILAGLPETERRRLLAIMEGAGPGVPAAGGDAATDEAARDPFQAPDGGPQGTAVRIPVEAGIDRGGDGEDDWSDTQRGRFDGAAAKGGPGKSFGGESVEGLEGSAEAVDGSTNDQPVAKQREVCTQWLWTSRLTARLAGTPCRPPTMSVCRCRFSSANPPRKRRSRFLRQPLSRGSTNTPAAAPQRGREGVGLFASDVLGTRTDGGAATIDFRFGF